MKHTKHLCDFCGGDITGEHATITVPMTQEEKELKKRADSGGKKRLSLMSEDLASALYSFPGIAWGNSADTRTFDMCMDCARRMIAARMHTLARIREAMGLEHEEVA